MGKVSFDFSVTLALPKLLCLGKKKKSFSLFCSRLFVTLQAKYEIDVKSQPKITKQNGKRQDCFRLN